MGGLGSGRPRTRWVLENLRQIRPADLLGRSPAIAAGTRRETAIAGYAASLEFERQPFGGARGWFRCACGRRCAVLYLLRNGWCCRQCTGLRYASQRHDVWERMRSRAFALFERLNVDYHVSPRHFGPKPRWMRWATYSRIAVKARSLDEAALVGSYCASRLCDSRIRR